MNSVSFFVLGQPVSKGNMSAISLPGKRYSTLIDSTKGLKQWSRAVWTEAFRNRPSSPWEGPIRVELEFFMRRPKSLASKVVWMVKKPDIDKLVRAVNDAMSGVIYVDDNQVCNISASKAYSDEPGVSILVERLEVE